MWEPQHLTTLWASTACYKDSFTFLILVVVVVVVVVAAAVVEVVVVVVVVLLQLLSVLASLIA
jgi:hypothetical protein